MKSFLHNKIAGGALAAYGGYNLYRDFATKGTSVIDWIGDALTFAVGITFFF